MNTNATFATATVKTYRRDNEVWVILDGANEQGVIVGRFRISSPANAHLTWRRADSCASDARRVLIAAGVQVTMDRKN